MGAQIPSVGRTVHYVSYGTPGGEYSSQCRAAVITAVEDPSGDAGGGILSLAILNPTGMFFNQGVSHVECGHAVGGTWHWPERV
jgi:hypothetical protein